MTDTSMGRIEYTWPWYKDNCYPVGFLDKIEKKHHALFHYYIMCQKLLEQAGKSIESQIRYDDAKWLDKPYGNIAFSVSLRYALADPSEFLHESIKHVVELEIARLGWPTPDPEYWNVEPGKVVLT